MSTSLFRFPWGYFPRYTNPSARSPLPSQTLNRHIHLSRCKTRSLARHRRSYLLRLRISCISITITIFLNPLVPFVSRNTPGFRSTPSFPNRLISWSYDFIPTHNSHSRQSTRLPSASLKLLVYMILDYDIYNVKYVHYVPPHSFVPSRILERHCFRSTVLIHPSSLCFRMFSDPYCPRSFLHIIKDRSAHAAATRARLINLTQCQKAISWQFYLIQDIICQGLAPQVSKTKRAPKGVRARAVLISQEKPASIKRMDVKTIENSRGSGMRRNGGRRI